MENNTNKIRVTTEWISENYEKLNQWLFNNSLGACNFGVFTSGSGSQGGTLGYFMISAEHICLNKKTRELVRKTPWSAFRTIIDRNNFYDVCQPFIKLNGNYIASEESLLNTLVHEMCHYYTYKDGYCPKQAHGREFKQIAQIVSSRSNGRFNIQRLASAEEAADYELDDEFKKKAAKRLANKKASLTALFIFLKNGMIELTLSSKSNLINEIIKLNMNEDPHARRNIHNVSKIITSNDSNLIDFLFNKGYEQAFRVYRYWKINPSRLGGEDFLDTNGYDYDIIYSKDNTPLNNVEKQDTLKKELFCIKTSNGVVEIPFNSKEQLVSKLKERFPKMSEETIEKIINNKANYKIMENKRNFINMIVETVMNEIKSNKKSNDVVELNPNMNLGLQSPLETEF